VEVVGASYMEVLMMPPTFGPCPLITGGEGDGSPYVGRLLDKIASGGRIE
jgi:hypothetical protein